jgi:hypothetical protein
MLLLSWSLIAALDTAPNLGAHVTLAAAIDAARSCLGSASAGRNSAFGPAVYVIEQLVIDGVARPPPLVRLTSGLRRKRTERTDAAE